MPSTRLLYGMWLLVSSARHTYTYDIDTSTSSTCCWQDICTLLPSALHRLTRIIVTTPGWTPHPHVMRLIETSARHTHTCDFGMTSVCTCYRHDVRSLMPSARLPHARVIGTTHDRSCRRRHVYMIIAHHVIHTASTCSFHQWGIYMPMSSARHLHTRGIQTASAC